jgi:chromosome partitioning protein
MTRRQFVTEPEKLHDVPVTIDPAAASVDSRSAPSDARFRMGLRELAALTDSSAPILAKKLGPESILQGADGHLGVAPDAVRGILEECGADFTFRTVAHINMRGGIGKTTAALSLAARAAQYGWRVCLLDLDSQGSASLAFGVVPESDDPVFYDVWQNPDELVAAAIRRVAENLYVLPSSLQNGLLDSSLQNPASQKKAVREVCRVLGESGFDLVVIDCPPSLGAAVISTICAVDTVVIPTGADAFSFKGIEITLREIRSICDTFSITLPRLRILYSRFDRRERVAVDAAARLANEFGEYLLPVPIRTCSEFNKALERRETVFAATTRSRAREDYDAYAREILQVPFVAEAAAAAHALQVDSAVVNTVGRGNLAPTERLSEAVIPAVDNTPLMKVARPARMRQVADPELDAVPDRLGHAARSTEEEDRVDG